MEILTSLGLSDLKRVLGIEALWFQFGGAGLLWWESNSGASFNVVRKRLEDPGMGWKTPPITSGERISRVIASAIMGGMVLLAAVVLVPLAWELWVRAAPHGWPLVETTEFQLLALLLTIVASFSVSVWFIDWRAKKTAQAISRAKTPRDAEWHARRAVRTIGFALVTVGTGLQVYPALCG